MNSETLREHQRILQNEHQQRCRELKRRIKTEKENTAPKRTKEITDEIIEISQIPKAHVYSWIHLNYIVIY